MPHPRARRASAAAGPAVAIAVALALALSGCGSGAAADAKPPRSLVVVASNWPLAQLAAYVGNGDTHVIDLAAPGLPPRPMALSSRDKTEMGTAGLVVDVGDGYQPAVEARARHAHHYLEVLPATSRTAMPYQFWLDPTLMSKAAAALASAMSKAAPWGRPTFQAGARDFESVATSVSSDYVNSLSTCTGHTFVTMDDAFSRLATRFGLQDIAATGMGQRGTASVVAKDHLGVVYSEDGVGSGLLQVVAAQSAVKVKALNPMEEVPLSGTPRQNSYFAVMEDNLQALEGGLTCDSSELFS